MTVLDDEAWSKVWDDYQRTAWRMETQPMYTMPREQPSLRKFLAGEPKPEAHNAAWHNQIREWTAMGKSVSRVRFVRQPLTDYQRYQLSWGIPGNVAAGENVRILDRTDDDFGLPEQDFWIYDDSVVVHLNFNPDGTLIDRELIEEPDMSKYRAWQAVALKNSVPLSEWNART